ncbi:MAG: PQQ-binding-like beta-propeller repeat protein, partial [bacterium]|nr:PQQ-binding-like beta-propeller repeat protein [bacterium]
MSKNHSIKFAVSLFAVVLLFSGSCQGEPEADNGENGNGDNVIDNGKVVWKAEIGITGLFKGVEFAEQDGRIYVVSLGEGLAQWDRFIEDPPKDQQEGVYCLAAESGEIIWHTDIGVDPFSDIALFEDRIYLYSRDSLLCMSADDGEIVWKYIVSEHINTESLAVSPEAIFAGHQDKVLAIKHDGSGQFWEATVPIRVRSLYYNDGRLYVGAEGNWEEVPAYLFCFDAANGEEIWRYEASDFHELDDPP